MNAISPAAQDRPDFPIDDLIWICTTLCDLLILENDALSRHDARAVRELTENKSALGKLYEKTLKGMARDGNLAKFLNQDQHAQLSQLGMRMAALMERNAIMLKAEIEARKKMMDVFVNAAKAITETKVSYSRSGVYDVPAAMRSRTSLTFNKTL